MAKQIKATTTRGVSSLLKSGELGLYAAGNGLYLKVNGINAGSWIFRYKINGKSDKVGLGSTDTVPLAQAGLLAAELRALIAQGINPKAHREAMEKQAEAERVTFAVAAADYIAAHRAGWKNAKHAMQWENTIQTYALPHIGKMPPSDIATAHVLKVLKPIWLEKPETASRVRNRIELILDAAKAQGLRDGENPARWRGHLDKLLPKREKVQAVKHHPALPWPELPAFMATLKRQQGTSYRAMEMTILTACRTSEVLNARWDEVDLETRGWSIPAERMKMRKEHRVPLADAMMKLLESLPRVEGNPHLFPGVKEGKPLSNMAMLMGLRYMKRDDLTMHGFRSTFRDWAGECTSHPRDVCEQALAHSLGNAVEAAYRRGDLFEKRRLLMEDWAAYATRLTTNNVVQLRKA
ncbi:tyrosine-type recombinase/integrase [Halopseudomonas sp.]|jgi:integrase|uniref:tyrosine-type recombinase/integrase n=1 Tax=Halopseudomonas sp. TaxID=2901191 RepID=UPI0039E375B5